MPITEIQGSRQIKAATISTDRLIDLAVTTAKLSDLAVTTGKLAASAVTAAKVLQTEIPVLSPSSEQAGFLNVNHAQPLQGGNLAATGGFRLGAFPGNAANTWVYLSKRDSAAYADLALGNMWLSGSLSGRSSAYFTGNVVVGGESFTASAAFEVRSTTQGFLPPRMTRTQANAIASPVEGLTVYVTDEDILSTYNGTTWDSAPTGSGAATRVPFWSSANVLASDADLTYHNVSNTLRVGDHYVHCCSYANAGNTTYGIKIKTEIPYIVGSNTMTTVIIEGYAYGLAQTVGLTLTFYSYNGSSLANSDKISSFGGYKPTVKLGAENGKVVIFLDDPGTNQYYTRFTVRAFAKGQNVAESHYQGWTVVDEAYAGTATVTLEYDNKFGGVTADSLLLLSQATSTTPMTVRGISGQTSNLASFQNNVNTEQLGIGPLGEITQPNVSMPSNKSFNILRSVNPNRSASSYESLLVQGNPKTSITQGTGTSEELLATSYAATKFTATDDNIGMVYVYLKKAVKALPTGYVRLHVYADNAGVPGTLLASSQLRYAHKISTTLTGYYFGLAVNITVGTTYWLALQRVSLDADDIYWHIDTSVRTGEYATYNGTSWTAESNKRARYVIYTMSARGIHAYSAGAGSNSSSGAAFYANSTTSSALYANAENATAVMAASGGGYGFHSDSFNGYFGVIRGAAGYGLLLDSYSGGQRTGHKIYAGDYDTPVTGNYLYFDAARAPLHKVYTMVSGAYSDNTTALSQTGGTATTLFSTAGTDYAYFGYSTGFYYLAFDFYGTPNVAGLLWEYWNGAAWTAFTPAADETDGFKRDGLVSWSTLSGWATTTLTAAGDSTARYWVRVSATTVTTAPVVTAAGRGYFSGHFAYWRNAGQIKYLVDNQGLMQTAGPIYPGSTSRFTSVQSARYLYDTGAALGVNTNWYVAGRLGVGILSPAELIHLALPSGDGLSTSRKAIQLSNGGWAAPGAGNTDSSGDKVIFYEASGGEAHKLGLEGAHVWIQSANGVRFYNSSAVEKARIALATGDNYFLTGNFGAGIAAPSEQIHSNANVRADGVFLASNGTVSVPGYSFSGDGNTGMYAYAADQIGLAAGGVLSALFTASGVRSRDGSAAAPSYGFFNDGDTGLFTPSTNSNIIAFTTAGVEKLRLTSAGSLLVGTSTEDTYRLDVSGGDARITNGTHEIRLASSGLSAGANVYTASDLFLGTTAAKKVALHTNNAERMQITSAGNVSIGGIAPNYALEIWNGAVAPHGNIELFPPRSNLGTSMEGAAMAIRMGRTSSVSGTVSATGGTLPDDYYVYYVTAFDDQSREGPYNATGLGAIITTGTTSSVTVSWSSVPGATKYRVYREALGLGAGPTYAANHYFETTNTSYVDTGAAGTAWTLGQEKGATNAISVELNAASGAHKIAGSLHLRDAPPVGATTAHLLLGPTALVSGNLNGTMIGTNPSAYSGDFFNFQINGASKAKIDAAGKLTVINALLSGVTANSYIGTDSSGNIVAKTAPITTESDTLETVTGRANYTQYGLELRRGAVSPRLTFYNDAWTDPSAYYRVGYESHATPSLTFSYKTVAGSPGTWADQLEIGYNGGSDWAYFIGYCDAYTFKNKSSALLVEIGSGAVGAKITLSDGTANANPSITSSSGIPGSSEANGSIYLKSDGGNSDGLWVRESGAWRQTPTVLKFTAAVSYAAIAAGETVDTTGMAVTGAELGDQVVVGLNTDIGAGWFAWGRVSAANTVKVSMSNLTGASATPNGGASVTFYVTILKH